MGQKLRQLRFANFDEMAADVVQLRQRGYDRGGEWDLLKIEDHLAKSIVAPLDGAGPKLFPPLSWVARFVIRRMARLQTYPNFKFPAPGFMQPGNPSATQASQSFDSAVDRAKQQSGPTVTTRAYGTVATSDWAALQLLHAAHHLGFLKPRDAST